MPAIEDWISNPISIVQNICDTASGADVKKVEKYFSERLQNPEAAAWIPCLNSLPQHNLRSGSLVRFRCMVQDMFDPEYYLGVYEVKNTTSGDVRTVNGMYQDLAQCKSGEQLEFDSPRNVTMDRQTLYCVPVPGETHWVKTSYKDKLKTSGGASTSCSASGGSKRGLEEEEGGDAMETEQPTPTDDGSTDAKRTKTDAVNGAKSSTSPSPVDLNFPLPGEKGPACLVKVYGEWEGIKVTDVLEVVGILSNDPALANFPSEQRQSAFADPAEDMMECTEEENARSPPPSLVPRLHAVCINKLKHNNPHLPHTLTPDVTSSIESEMSQLHRALSDVLSRALLGDSVATQYLLCHLISTVYARHDVVPVGKFGLNLSGCPRGAKYAQHLHSILEQLVTATHYLPMTLDNMNKSTFCPKKDYKANRLRSGVLQLSQHTHVVVDETVMQAGQLDATGVRNLTALGTVVRWQKVEYDFDFHKQDFETNLPTLVLSEGKSLIQCDSHVVLIPSLTVDDLEHHFSQLSAELQASTLLQRLRAYLTYARLMEYTLADDVQKKIEEDFVEMRKEDSKKLTIDDFHGLLILARLLSLSRGQKTLTEDIWCEAKTLEDQRKQRLRQINAPPS